MATLNITNTFTANGLIKSADMNTNFNDIKTFFNSTGIDSTNIAPLGILHASLALASVQKDSLNSNVVDGTTITGGAGTALSLLAGCVDLTKLAATVAQALSPTGSIVAYSGTSAPAGWLLCNGASVSSTTYSALSGVLGGAYGVGSGVFNLPDFRGRFLRGVDGAAGNDPDSASRTIMNTGGNAGNAIGSIQGDAFQSHVHTIFTAANAAGGSGVGSVGGGSGIPGGSAGTSTETRPKNAYVNFIIKT